MMYRMLAGAACAALTVFAAPVSAATTPSTIPYHAVNGSADQAVSAFYASRNGSPLWLRGGTASPAARDLVRLLRQGSLDGSP
jgi:type IV secretory pathway protease TraF